jgi:hypothetical protein
MTSTARSASIETVASAEEIWGAFVSRGEDEPLGATSPGVREWDPPHRLSIVDSTSPTLMSLTSMVIEDRGTSRAVTVTIELTGGRLVRVISALAMRRLLARVLDELVASLPSR